MAKATLGAPLQHHAHLSTIIPLVHTYICPYSHPHSTHFFHTEQSHPCSQVPVASGEVVIKQGDVGNRFYVVESGIRPTAHIPPRSPRRSAPSAHRLRGTGTAGTYSATIAVDDQQVAVMQYNTHACFGELALMYTLPPHIAPPDIAPPDIAPPDIAPPDIAPLGIAPPAISPTDIALPAITTPAIAPPGISKLTCHRLTSRDHRYSKPRAATVTALSSGFLWAVDRRSFRSILMKVRSPRSFTPSRSHPTLHTLSFTPIHPHDATLLRE
jgi:CRP-like cAMP-binding protein